MRLRLSDVSAYLLEAKKASVKMQGEPESAEAVPKVSVIQPTVVSKPFPAPSGHCPLTHTWGIPHVNWRPSPTSCLLNNKLPHAVQTRVTGGLARQGLAIFSL